MVMIPFDQKGRGVIILALIGIAALALVGGYACFADISI